MTSCTVDSQLITDIMDKINQAAVGILYTGWFEHLEAIPASAEPCEICAAYTEAIQELSK
jgi:hypothetical protein